MDSKVIMCSVGDLMLSDSPLYVSVGVGTSYQKIKGQIFKDCVQEFESADIVIGNLESVVYKPRKNSLSELQMSCSEEMIEELQSAGFNVLNIANNHCLQHGTDGFRNTKYKCEKLGMHCIGFKNERPYQINVNGIRLAFLSICLYTEFYQPNDIQYEDDISCIIDKVKKLKKDDGELVVVLSVHWGDEFATYPCDTQVELAHLLIDSGVDILLGHHSHVYQGIEKYKGSLILYSQGNFVSDMIPEICRKTGIVKITIRNEKQKKKIDYEMTPYYIGDDFIPVRENTNWFEGRKRELKLAIDKSIPRDTYMNIVRENHRSCHDIFKDRFIRSLFRYRPHIFVSMMFAFIVRKAKKKIGIWPGRYDLDKTLCLAQENMKVR